MDSVTNQGKQNLAPCLQTQESSLLVGVAAWILDQVGPAAVTRAAELGFSCIQIDFGNPVDEYCLKHPQTRLAFIDAAKASVVKLAAIAVNALNDIGMTSPLSAITALCSQTISEAVCAAGEMGIGLVILPSFEAGEIRDDDDFKRTALHLQNACELASNWDRLDVATENTLGIQDNRNLISAVGHSRLKVLLDTQNPVLWGHDPVDMVRSLQDIISDQVHIKDGSYAIMGNKTLGMGIARIDRTLKTLYEIGSSWHLILENEYTTDLEAEIRRDMKVLLSLVP